MIILPRVFLKINTNFQISPIFHMTDVVFHQYLAKA